MFRGSSTQHYVPVFTQKDFHYNVYTGLPTQGISTEDLGKYNLGVHNSSLNKYNLSLEARHKAKTIITSHLRDKALSQTTINLSLEGLGSKPQLNNYLYT